MSRVLVFKETLLPPSETFVLAQATALARYQARLCGLERSHPSLPLNSDLLLLADGSSAYCRLRAKIYRRTGVAPLFHRRAQRWRPDLIHAHFANGGVTAMPLALHTGAPLVVTLHGADVTVHSTRDHGYARLAKTAARFICVSEFIRDQALLAGFPADKLSVHYIGIDRAFFSPPAVPAPTRRILFVGRLVEKKGCACLLRAMPSVQAENPDCELLVAGDGPLRAELEALGRSLKIRCSFLGTQTPQAVRQLLETARVFCVPSVTAEDGDSEGLGLVFVEAQAMGVPVVSTLHGGIPEAVRHGETGLLVSERNSSALAEALSTLLRDDQLWSGFHRAAPLHVAERFDLRTQTGLLEDIYDDCRAH